MSKRKYGSFVVNMKNENKEIEEIIVNPLNQHDLSNGWRLVLPNKKNF